MSLEIITLDPYYIDTISQDRNMFWENYCETDMSLLYIPCEIMEGLDLCCLGSH